MTSAGPELSIIVPTADRQDCAEIVVNTLLRACPDAEIVVSDTSVDPVLAERLAAPIAAGRVVYTRPAVGLDVVGNFEHALGCATGDYLMFIGDDDCVGPGVASIAHWAKTQGVEAVIPYGNTLVTIYYWPGVVSKYFRDGYSAKLFVWKFDGLAKPVDPVQAMKAALKNLGSGLGMMPRAYHGLVSRQLVDRIRAKHGRLFGGVSPDIFSAALIASESRSTWHVSYPFNLPGASPRSTAGLGAARTDRSTIWDNPHIAPFKDLVWDPLIPEFYSPNTVWAYSFKKAIDVIGRDDLKPNLARLYARCLIYNFSYFPAIRRSFTAYAQQKGWLGSSFAVAVEIAGELTRFGRRILQGVLRPTAGASASARIDNLPDVAAAYDALVDYVSSEAANVSLNLPGNSEALNTT